MNLIKENNIPSDNIIRGYMIYNEHRKCMKKWPT